MSPPRKKEKKEEVAGPPSKILHSGTIRLVRNKLYLRHHSSGHTNVGGLKWRGSVGKERLAIRLGGGGCKAEFDLVASFECAMHSPSSLWSVDVNARFELINAESSKNIVKTKSYTFNNKSDTCKDVLIHWKDVLDEANGFIVRENVTIIINFSITNIRGFITYDPPELDFTDPNEPRHDVALVMEGGKVYASKAILATYSPVFNAMFFGGFNEKDKKEIELKDVKKDEFIEMLRVIYPSQQKITDDNVAYLLNLGDRFDINFIAFHSENHLISSSKLEYILKLLLSDRYRLIKLQSECMGHFFENQQTWDRFKASAEYNELSKEIRDRLVKRNSYHLF